MYSPQLLLKDFRVHGTCAEKASLLFWSLEVMGRIGESKSNKFFHLHSIVCDTFWTAHAQMMLTLLQKSRSSYLYALREFRSDRCCDFIAYRVMTLTKGKALSKQIMFVKPTVDDSGVYRCAARALGGEMQEKSINISFIRKSLAVCFL